MIGERLLQYQITARLGAGGMGEVYLAEDSKLGREVAIKVLPPDLAASRDRLDRFRREARTLAAVDHPNIVHLYSVDEADGVHFLAMQLVRGEPLSARIRQAGLPIEELFDVAIPLADVLSLHGEVAQALAERAIRVTLSPEERERMATERRVDPESYQAYLRGMHWLNKGTPDGIARGMEHLREAVENDPGEALAYAGLALGYITVAHGPEPPPDALDQARSAAEKAVRLDDTLAEAHAALAFLYGYYDWQWERARRSLDRALEINPSLAIAHYHDAWFEALFGRMEQAIEAHRRAQELDPMMPLHTAWLGELYRMVGRYEEAIAEAERSIGIAPGFPPGHFVLGKTYLDQGRHDEAIAAYQRAAAAAPPWQWPVGVGLARAGRLEEARRVLRELEAQPVTPWRALWLAQLHGALGNRDEAFRWLTYEHPHAFVPWVRVLDWFEPLRDDPRFDALLDRMNLPPLES